MKLIDTYGGPFLCVEQRLARTCWLASPFGQGLSIEPDIDLLPVFAEERASAWSRIEASSVLTANEKRTALGLGRSRAAT